MHAGDALLPRLTDRATRSQPRLTPLRRQTLISVGSTCNNLDSHPSNSARTALSVVTCDAQQPYLELLIAPRTSASLRRPWSHRHTIPYEPIADIPSHSTFSTYSCHGPREPSVRLGKVPHQARAGQQVKALRSSLIHTHAHVLDFWQVISKPYCHHPIASSGLSRVRFPLGDTEPGQSSYCL